MPYQQTACWRLAALARHVAGSRAAGSSAGSPDDILAAHWAANPHVKSQLKVDTAPAADGLGAAMSPLLEVADALPAPLRQTENRVLAERHRVAITQFTLLSQNGLKAGVAPFKTLDELCAWAI